MNKIICLIICFLVGILIFYMLQNLCACKVVEGLVNNENKIQLIYGEVGGRFPPHPVAAASSQINLPAPGPPKLPDPGFMHINGKIVEGQVNGDTNLWGNLSNLPPREQGHICWSEALGQIIKGQYFLKYGREFNPSIQFILDCQMHNRQINEFTVAEANNIKDARTNPQILDNDIIEVIYNIFITPIQRVYSIDDYPEAWGVKDGKRVPPTDTSCKKPAHNNPINMTITDVTLVGTHDAQIKAALINNNILMSHIYLNPQDMTRLRNLGGKAGGYEENDPALFLNFGGDDSDLLWLWHFDKVTGQHTCVHDLSGLYCDNAIVDSGPNFVNLGQCVACGLPDEQKKHFGNSSPYCRKYSESAWEIMESTESGGGGVDDQILSGDDCMGEWINEDLAQKVSPWPEHDYCRYECNNRWDPDRKSKKKCAISNHAVLIIGDKSHEGKNYWIVKNNWGDDWGYNGCFYVQKISDYKPNDGVLGQYDGKASLLGINQYNCYITISDQTIIDQTNCNDVPGGNLMPDNVIRSLSGESTTSCESLLKTFMPFGGCNNNTDDMGLAEDDQLGDRRLGDSGVCCNTCYGVKESWTEPPPPTPPPQVFVDDAEPDDILPATPPCPGGDAGAPGVGDCIDREWYCGAGDVNCEEPDTRTDCCATCNADAGANTITSDTDTGTVGAAVPACPDDLIKPPSTQCQEILDLGYSCSTDMVRVGYPESFAGQQLKEYCQTTCCGAAPGDGH